LIRAAAALNVLELSGDDIIWGETGAALAAQPWILKFIAHHKYFYRDLEDPVALLRGEPNTHALKDFWGYDNPGADRSAYSDLMAESQAAVSEQILLAHDFTPHRKMLDIGGGSGAFLAAVAACYPKLEMHLFDLPGVQGTGPFQRHAGDFRTDSLPAGMDLVSLVRVVHDHDDTVVVALFHKLHAAAAPSATLLIAEPFAGSRATDAYFTLYFAAMGQGRLRTPGEIAALAAPAGWGQLRVQRTNLPMITGLLTLRRM
jgi:demethylspheroidene O-methyltransferase